MDDPRQAVDEEQPGPLLGRPGNGPQSGVSNSWSSINVSKSERDYTRINAIRSNGEEPSEDQEDAMKQGCCLPCGRAVVAGGVAGVAFVCFISLMFGFLVGKRSATSEYQAGRASEQQSCYWDGGRSGGDYTVILVSSDGFRWDYWHKVPTPNIDRLRNSGTEAENGMIPVFPAITFPSHYSMATGLHPESHGIIANAFRNPGNASDWFHMNNHDPKWWLGEPIWETAEKQGMLAATFFWPGTEVKKGAWQCPPDRCMAYDRSIPFDARVNTVLDWLRLPKEKRPRLISLYFEEPDWQGHQAGPDSPQVSEGVQRVDAAIGQLLDGIEKQDLWDTTHVILVGDHGMASVCDCRTVFLEDLAPWVSIKEEWVDSYSPILSIWPPADTDVKRVEGNMATGLAPGGMANGAFLQVHLKEDIPAKYHFSNSDRIAPIVGLAAEGYAVRATRNAAEKGLVCGGMHGFDNQLLSMRTIFAARGPRFGRGRKVPSFQNVELYNIVCDILGLNKAPNNGTPGFTSELLLNRCD